MSSARDRVKQAATATGTYAFSLAGAAEDGFLTFANAYQMPTPGSLAGTLNWFDIPVLVEVISGSQAGKWQTMYCDLTRDGSGNLSLAGGATRIIANSDMVANTLITPLALVNTDAVVLSVCPPGYGYISVRSRPTLTNVNNGLGGTPGGSGTDVVARGANALLACGANAYANGAGGIAIGDGAAATGKYGVGIGAEAGAGASYGAVIGGYNAYPNHAYEVAGGIGDVNLLQGGTTPVAFWHMHCHGIMQLATTGATPTLLTGHDPLIAPDGSGNTSPLGGSPTEIYCDAGITRIKGSLIAYNPANDDAKVWEIDASVKTNMAYSSTALFGTPTITVVNADAGAAAWDVDVIAVTEGVTFEVTGAAATEILWLFKYDAHYTQIYV